MTEKYIVRLKVFLSFLKIFMYNPIMKNKVIEILKERNIEHEIVNVPKEMEGKLDQLVNFHKVPLSNLIKTLVYRADGRLIAVQARGDSRMSSSSLKKALKIKSLSMAQEQDLVELGITIGHVPIAGLDIDFFVDKGVLEIDKIYCGTGVADTSVGLKGSDLPKLNDGAVINVAEIVGDGKKRILTGDRPTGKMHIGHYFGSLKNRAALQDEYEQYIVIANIHALSDNSGDPQKVRSSIEELLCDYYAVGIDFSKTTVYIQSEVPETHEIFMYLSNFATVQQIAHNPTIKTELKQNDMESSTPLGFFLYPIHQAADILCVNADLVPVGKDQAPMIEDTRELARKFNSTYKVKLLSQPQALFGVEVNVPGTDGNAKMGKSLNNCIYLSDTQEELKKKVMSVYTDPKRIRATDPGTVEGNVAFAYMDLFNDNKAEVEELKRRYRGGTVGDVEIKERLFEIMNEKLTPIRERRLEAEKIKEQLLKSALDGSKKVSGIARGIADSMKEAMMIKF